MAKQKQIKQSKGPLARIKFNTVPDKTVRKDLGGTNVTEVSSIFTQNSVESKVEEGLVPDSGNSKENESTITGSVSDVPQRYVSDTGAVSKKAEENITSKPASGPERKPSGRSNKKEDKVGDVIASRLPADFHSRISDKTKSASFNLHMDFDLYFDIMAIFECDGYRGRGVKEPMLCDVLKEWAENTKKKISADSFDSHRSEVIKDFLNKVENKKKKD